MKIEKAGREEKTIYSSEESVKLVDEISGRFSRPGSLLSRDGSERKDSPFSRRRRRQAHSLFDEKGSSAQFDVEAVKLDHTRKVWRAEDRRPSISSEESLSDYEEVGTVSEGLDLQGRRDQQDGGAQIWDIREIQTCLRSMCYRTYNKEDAYSIFEMENQDSIIQAIQDLVNPGADLGALLLAAVWEEKESVVENLLRKKVSPDTRDTEGRSCLHLAAVRDNPVILSLLLEFKGSVNCWDGSERATPLFCAAAIENSKCLPILLASGADLNQGLHEYGLSAVHCATSSNAINNLTSLLQMGAQPNSVLLYSETPLHIASSMGYSECMRILLDHGAGTEMLIGSMRMSALHLAAQEGNVNCASLLLNCGADPHAKNARGQSALHLAALSQSPETMELLLSKGADPECEDIDCRTPLHSAIVKGSRSYECVRMLLDARGDVNHQDSFGYSPLHIAALNEYSYCASLLLSYGADVTIRTNGGTSALSMIVRKIPSVLPKFEDMLDEAITLAEHDINDVDCELKLDYKVLIPNKARGESAMFIAFIETGHNHLLKHPLCESFLHLKWLKVRKFFFVSLVFHLVFTMLHTIYVLQVYTGQCILQNNCEKRNNSDFSNVSPLKSGVSVEGKCFIPYIEKCRITMSTIVVWILLIISTLILSAKEIFQLMHSQKLYFCNWENWVQWGIIISVMTVSFHTNPFPNLDVYVHLVERWQHHAAAIGVFLVWGELMLMVGRLPTFGIYVQMFTTVAKNFFKFLTAYFCLLVAFALSFCVLVPNYRSFNANVVFAVVKSLVMMAGEIEYEDIIYENGEELYPVTGHMMILLFVVLISIILMNLLVGLAVSDIQGLQKCAGLDRLVRQTELISHIESMLFTRLLLFLPTKFLDVLHQSALVVPHAYNWTFTIRPNDIREDRLSRDITESVHALVSRRHQSKKRRPFSRYTARADRVRREKSFAMEEVSGSVGVNLEEQILEVRSVLAAIQVQNTSLKRNLDVMKANLQFLINSPEPRKDENCNEKAGVHHITEKIQKSFKGIFPPEPDPEKLNKVKQDNESLRDLVNNLTNLALAITEDRNQKEDEEEEGEGSRENNLAPETQKYERKFGSLEKKLKRTNLMRRRESQALLVGLRKTRSSTGILQKP